MARKDGVSRRRFLQNSVRVAAAMELQRAAWALGLGPGTAVCNTVAAEQEVGPYYVPGELLRADIREGKPGIPLQLRLVVLDVRRCAPLAGAALDVWHCDARGLYAGYTAMRPMGAPLGEAGGVTGAPPPWDGHPPPGIEGAPPPPSDPAHPGLPLGPPEGLGAPPSMHPTDQFTFLRGVQFTDSQGQVVFHTVFPGVYMGRTNHIHFKVREGGRVGKRAGSESGETYLEGHTCHTGQVFFPEPVAAALMQQGVYLEHRIHRTTQAEDMVFQGQHGQQMLAMLKLADPKRPERGYVAQLVVAVDPAASPAPVGPGRPGPPRGGQAAG